jgi:hypothetical protein
MAFFTQTMGEMAVELAALDPNYEDKAFKFLYISPSSRRP